MAPRTVERVSITPPPKSRSSDSNDPAPKKCLTIVSRAVKKQLLEPLTTVDVAAKKFELFNFINEEYDRGASERSISTQSTLINEYNRDDGSLFVEMKLHEGYDPSRISCNTRIVFRYTNIKNRKGAYPMFGVIKKFDIDTGEMTVMVSEKDSRGFVFYGSEFVTIDLWVNWNEFKIQHYAIQRINDNLRFHQKLMFPDDNHTMPVAIKAEFFNGKTVEIPPPLKMPVQLNPEQREAVHQITRETKSTFVLFGPPGTGKTSTLIEAIAKLVSKGGRILICTPTNSAANVVAEKLIDRGLRDFTYRLLAPTVDRYDMSKKVLSVCEPATEITVKGKKKLIYESPDNLNGFPIIVVTLDSAYRLPKIVDVPFTHLIVDEAGQVPEMKVWKPLSDFGDNARLILAGDPKQLGPFVKADFLKQERYGYEISMVSRLSEYELFKENLYLMVLLTKNYRSHKAIVDSFSQLFYEGKIEHMTPKDHASLCQWPRLPRKQFPLIFHNVKGNVRAILRGSSLNIMEANVVLDYIRTLTNPSYAKANALQEPVSEEDIGVVSFYKYQTHYIRKALGPDSKVTVDSIERFQGDERRVIIMTTVKTGKNIGFLKNPARLNTAISRAKQLLIVVGHASSLKNVPIWNSFIQYVKDNGGYIQS